MEATETYREQVLEYLKSEVAKHESSERYEHTLSVLEEVGTLAKLFGLSKEDRFKLKKAAILHDITKDFSSEKQLELCAKYGIKTDKKPGDMMPIIHQDTGAAFALDLFGEGIVEKEVYSAISCHTTGKVGMTLMDKLLFVADYLEPTRRYETCKTARHNFYKKCIENKDNRDMLLKALDEAIEECIENTVTVLLQRRYEIDDRVIPLWNSLINSGGH